MLKRGMVVIDLDNCLTQEEGGIRITRTAQRVYELAHSYTEISPSGKGLHVFLRGNLPEVNGQKQDGMKSALGEMYESKRYITITGERIGQMQEIRADQEAINQIYALLKSPEREQAQPPQEQRSCSLVREDEEVLSKASKARNGSKFTALYRGDITSYRSKSEAQLALISMLVYWTNKDTAQVERLFKSSDLYDEETGSKWDTKHRSDGATYGQITIEKALRTTRQL
jgi:putative DNA primase/helicase